MTKEKLIEAMGCSEATAEKWFRELNVAMDCFEINTSKRMAAFIAQIGHESGSLSITEENMNYSEQGLLSIFGKYFTTETAKDYARQPEKIGNKVYANRMGNGDEQSGDGFRYRGRGLMQLTGKDDYKDCGEALGIDLVAFPEMLKEPRNAAMSAGWEWDRGGLNAHADLDNFERITKIINGGLNGYADRLTRWDKAKKAFNSTQGA